MSDLCKHGRQLCDDCGVEDAVLAERERCANLVEGWYQFEAKNGGTSFCIACNQALRIAKAIREPEYAAEVEKLRVEYEHMRLEVSGQ